MDHLINIFADIGGSKDSRPREEVQSAAHQSGFDTVSISTETTREAKDNRDSKDDSQDSRDARRRTLSRTHTSRRDTSRNGRENRRRDPSRQSWRAPSTRDNRERERRGSRESRDWETKDKETRERGNSRDSKDSKEARDTKEPKEGYYARDLKESKFYDDTEPGPPPYQEIADANVPPPTPTSHSHKHDNNQNQSTNIEFEPNHPSGITPTERCVKEAISAAVDWVIHPSAPHFVICGRCYIDRIYETHQWRRDFVKYRPSTGLSLRCHLGAIPHMDKRWAKVHTAEEFLSFLKVMQRKKVAKHCPGVEYPSSSAVWYNTSSVPGLNVCEECHQKLFGGTVFSKKFTPSETSTSSICHGAFRYTERMVDALFKDDDWDHFAEAMKLRIRFSSCSRQRDDDSTEDDEGGWWYKYMKTLTRDLYICEACYFDHVFKTENEGVFILGDRLTTKPQCMASLKSNSICQTADIEYARAEIMHLLHGVDRRCYSAGTVGLKWFTTSNNPRGYGVCEGCYVSKIKPLGGDKHYMVKRDVGKRSSFACWMNSYHPFSKRHDKLLTEGLILGDLSRLENSIGRFQRTPGCQQGGMGQGKNRRWWGWGSLRICQACVKGGSLVDTPTGKKFELHGEKDPYHRFCDLYSMQLRDRFNHDDVGKLLEFAKKRQEMMM